MSNKQIGVTDINTLLDTLAPTRVEVIGLKGREFSKWLINNNYRISVQDEGKTIKLFEQKE